MFRFAKGRFSRKTRNFVKNNPLPADFPDYGRNAAIRFTFQARQTRLHSPLTFFKPRTENWRKPITDLMMPNTVKRHKVVREIDLKSSHRQIRERVILKNRYLSTRCRIIDVKSSHLAGKADAFNGEILRRFCPGVMPILLS